MIQEKKKTKGSKSEIKPIHAIRMKKSSLTVRANKISPISYETFPSKTTFVGLTPNSDLTARNDTIRVHSALISQRAN